jgi:hypothetical protein
MRGWSAAGATLLGLGVLTAPLLARVYSEAPPPAHTGGLGEPSCRQCHFDGALNDSAGALTLSGVPDAYRSGEPVRITVAVRHPEMRRGGFQLAARFANGERAGEQAGSLGPADARAEVTRAGGIEYIHHTRGGTALTGPADAAWSFDWTPPANGGDVIFHVAANAANGDDSELGDWIYLADALSRLRDGR